MKVYRYPLMKGISFDTAALPCPRCRSTNIETMSHPACGTMVTCLSCGGRSSRRDWNDGEITLQRRAGKQTFRYSGEWFLRPATDKIIRTTRAKAHRAIKAKETAA